MTSLNCIAMNCILRSVSIKNTGVGIVGCPYNYTEKSSRNGQLSAYMVGTARVTFSESELPVQPVLQVTSQSQNCLLAFL